MGAASAGLGGRDTEAMLPPGVPGREGRVTQPRRQPARRCARGGLVTRVRPAEDAQRMATPAARAPPATASESAAGNRPTGRGSGSRGGSPPRAGWRPARVGEEERRVRGGRRGRPRREAVCGVMRPRRSNGPPGARATSMAVAIRSGPATRSVARVDEDAEPGETAGGAATRVTARTAPRCRTIRAPEGGGGGHDELRRWPHPWRTSLGELTCESCSVARRIVPDPWLCVPAFQRVCPFSGWCV